MINQNNICLFACQNPVSQPFERVKADWLITERRDRFLIPFKRHRIGFNHSDNLSATERYFFRSKKLSEFTGFFAEVGR
nr:hypothetical protein BDDEJBFL_00194 [Agrobacterium fabrum]